MMNLNTGCKRKAGISVVAYLVALACSVSYASAGETRVGGAEDDCRGYFEVFKELFQEKMGIDMLIKPSSSVQGLIDLDRGKIDISTTDVPLEKLVTELADKGYPVVQESFQAQGIGTSPILVYLNQTNKVTELTQQQLSDIFTGVITNWQQIGGDNQGIVVVWGDEMTEKNRLFQQFIIGSKPIVKTAVWVARQVDVIEQIVVTPGAIGIASNAYASAQTRNPKTPFVSANVYALTKGAPSKYVQNLLEEIKSFDN